MSTPRNINPAQQMDLDRKEKHETQDFKKLILDTDPDVSVSDTDPDPSLAPQPGLKVFRELCAKRELIKVNTTELVIESILWDGIEFHEGEKDHIRELPRKKGRKELAKKEKAIIELKEVYKALDEVMNSVNHQSILSVVCELGKFGANRWDNYDCFDPHQSSYYHQHQTLLSTISKYQNLVKFEFTSRDTTSGFEEEVPKILINLPNLEDLKLARSFRAQDWEWSMNKSAHWEKKTGRKVGEQIGSLTKLKHLYLENLLLPHESWRHLDWKSNLESLKITHCCGLHSLGIFNFALLFKHSLKSLLIGMTSPISQDYTSPKFDHGSEFLVLKELIIKGGIEDPTTDEMNADQILLDTLGKCPQLEHFNFSSSYESGLIKFIKKSNSTSNSNWRSLKTLIINEEIELDGILDEKFEEDNIREWDIKHNILYFESLDRNCPLWNRTDDMFCSVPMGKIRLSEKREVEVRLLDTWWLTPEIDDEFHLS